VISGRENHEWPLDDKGESKRPKDIGEHLTKAVRAVVKQNPSLSGIIDVVDFAAERNGERDVNPAKLLQPLKDRAERILKDLEERKTTGLAAMDLLAALAAEKDTAAKAAKETGLSPRAFGVFWALRDNAAMKSAGIAPLDLAKETEKLMARFLNARVNADEQRQFRAALYRPLLAVGREERTKIVDLIVEIVTQ
jgi:type I restriction enzyme R subunit